MAPDAVRDPRMPLRGIDFMYRNSLKKTAIAKFFAYNFNLAWNDDVRISSDRNTDFLNNLTLQQSGCIHCKHRRKIRCLNGRRMAIDDYIYRRCLGIAEKYRFKNKIRRTCTGANNRETSDNLCMNPSHMYYTVKEKDILDTSADAIINEKLNSTFLKMTAKKNLAHAVLKTEKNYVPADVNDDDRLLFGKIDPKEVCIFEGSTMPESMECDADPMMIDQYKIEESPYEFETPSFSLSDYKMKDTKIIEPTLFQEDENRYELVQDNKVFYEIKIVEDSPIDHDQDTWSYEGRAMVKDESMQSMKEAVMRELDGETEQELFAIVSLDVLMMLKMETHIYIYFGDKLETVIVQDFFFS